MSLKRRGEFALVGSMVHPLPPEHEGLPTPQMLAESAASIAAVQMPSGAIPWEITGDTMGRIDAWDHTEAAMALTIYGPPGAAERAFEWLASEQRADGTWPREWLADMSGHMSRGLAGRPARGSAGGGYAGAAPGSDDQAVDGAVVAAVNGVAEGPVDGHLNRYEGDVPFGRGHATAVDLGLGVTALDGSREHAELRERARPRVVDEMCDANMTAYIAVGVWHHWLTRGDRGFVEEMWPVVRRALDAVCDLALPFGGIAWARENGVAAKTALVAGSSSMHHALRCGVQTAQLLGHEAARWNAVADGIADALRHREDEFEPKARFAMDWYYPVLGGVLRGEAGARRLAERWGEFVVPEIGVRCVDDHPWVTAAESCELALSALAVGLRDQARAIVESVQHLRAPDGSYHTGYVFTDGKRWPIEQSTWTSAAVILAADALADEPRGGNIFGLP